VLRRPFGVVSEFVTIRRGSREVVALIVSLVVLTFPISVGAYHTPDHFCEQCVAESCGGGASDRNYLWCVSSACGIECEVWVADRFGATDGCVAQCDAMLETCQMASEDSGGLIDDYCADTAQACYVDCEGGVEDEDDMYIEEGGEDGYAVLDEE